MDPSFVGLRPAFAVLFKKEIKKSETEIWDQKVIIYSEKKIKRIVYFKS